MISPRFPSRSSGNASLAAIRRRSRSGDTASAHALARDEYVEAIRRGDRPAQAELATELAWIAMMMGDAADGIALAREAAAIFVGLCDREGEALARAALGWLLAGVGDPDAVDEAERAISFAEPADCSTASIAHLGAGIVFHTLREHDCALRHLRTAEDLAARAGDRVLQARVALNLATVRALLPAPSGWAGGERPCAIRAMEHALALASAARDSWAARIALCNLAELMVAEGRPADALALLERHDALGGQAASPDRAHLDLARATCRIAQGRFAEAELLLRRCLAACADGNWVELRIQAIRDLTDLLSRTGRFEEALDAHRRFHAFYVAQGDGATLVRARAAASEHERKALSRAAEAAREEADALALRNAALTARTDLLLRHSLEDSLTGLPNRRRLDHELDELRCTTAASYAIAMVDIDHFKQVNDELSHPVGDRVLRTVGRLLREELRAPDFLARYGGEEFTAVIRTTDWGDAAIIAERLRQAVRDGPWAAFARRLRITVSIGVAVSIEGADPRDVLAIADLRLRDAKKAGRDRVIATVQAPPGATDGFRQPLNGLH